MDKKTLLVVVTAAVMLAFSAKATWNYMSSGFMFDVRSLICQGLVVKTDP